MFRSTVSRCAVLLTLPLSLISALPSHAEDTLPASSVAPSSGITRSSPLSDFLRQMAASSELRLDEAQSGWVQARFRPRTSLGEKQAEDRIMPHDEFVRDLYRIFAGEPDVLLTRGETVQSGGTEYLLAYRVKFPTRQQMDKDFEAEWKKTLQPNRDPEPAEIERITFNYVSRLPLRASLLRPADFIIEEIAPFSFERRKADFSAWLKPMIEEQQQLRQRRLQQTVIDTLKALHNAAQQYAQNHDGALPPLENIDAARVALWPNARQADSYATFDARRRQSLRVNSLLSGRKLAAVKPFGASLVLFYSAPDEAGERDVIFLNGTVRSISAAEWPRVRAASRLPETE